MYLEHGRTDHFRRRGQERKVTWYSSDYSFSFRHCKLTSCEYDGIDEWYITETSAQLESEKKNQSLENKFKLSSFGWCFVFHACNFFRLVFSFTAFFSPAPLLVTAPFEFPYQPAYNLLLFCNSLHRRALSTFPLSFLPVSNFF